MTQEGQGKKLRQLIGDDEFLPVVVRVGLEAAVERVVLLGDDCLCDDSIFVKFALKYITWLQIEFGLSLIRMSSSREHRSVRSFSLVISSFLLRFG